MRAIIAEFRRFQFSLQIYRENTHLYHNITISLYYDTTEQNKTHAAVEWRGAAGPGLSRMADKTHKTHPYCFLKHIKSRAAGQGLPAVGGRRTCRARALLPGLGRAGGRAGPKTHLYSYHIQSMIKSR